MFAFCGRLRRRCVGNASINRRCHEFPGTARQQSRQFPVFDSFLQRESSAMRGATGLWCRFRIESSPRHSIVAVSKPGASIAGRSRPQELVQDAMSRFRRTNLGYQLGKKLSVEGERILGDGVDAMARSSCNSAMTCDVRAAIPKNRFRK